MPFSLGFSVAGGFANSAAVGPVELWPQPDFASSAGLTFTAFDGGPPSVAGGQLLFGDGSQDGTASGTSLATIVPGTYRITAKSANGAGQYQVFVSEGSAGGDIIFDGNTTSDETHDVVITAVGNQTIQIANNYVGQTLDTFSVEQIA